MMINIIASKQFDCCILYHPGLRQLFSSFRLSSWPNRARRDYLNAVESPRAYDYMKNTIAVYLEENPIFATFIGLVKFSALYQDLHRSLNLTVMALPNEVFHGMNRNDFSQLINETRETMKNIIARHIIESRYKSNNLIHGTRIQTMNGSNIIVHNKDGVLKINNSLVIRSDIRLSNGVLHVLDSMLRHDPVVQCPMLNGNIEGK